MLRSALRLCRVCPDFAPRTRPLAEVDCAHHSGHSSLEALPGGGQEIERYRGSCVSPLLTLAPLTAALTQSPTRVPASHHHTPGYSRTFRSPNRPCVRNSVTFARAVRSVVYLNTYAVVTEPQDLRSLQRPVTELLSDASAGSPGDDAFDISIIRESWIRSRVEKVYSEVEQVTLKCVQWRVSSINEITVLICSLYQAPDRNFQC